MQLTTIETARRRHINRSGRWSEQKTTPALTSRGDTKSHCYNTLILADLRGRDNE